MATVRPRKGVIPNVSDKLATWKKWEKYANNHTVMEACKHYKIAEKTYFNYRKWYLEEYMTGVPKEPEPKEEKEIDPQEAFLKLYRDNPFELLTCEHLGVSEDDFKDWMKDEDFKKKLEYTKRIADELAKKRMRDIGMGLVSEDLLSSKANPTALEKYLKLDDPSKFASQGTKAANKDNKPSRIKINVKAGIK